MTRAHPLPCIAKAVACSVLPRKPIYSSANHLHYRRKLADAACERAACPSIRVHDWNVLTLEARAQAAALCGRAAG